jgi:hypothetical protein
MQIVVARYNEDVEWTKKYDNVIIYNKGLPLNGYSNVVELPNVGREGHTYYHHIYTNYDTLDEYTIFLQGNPFDHSPNILEDLKKLDDYNTDYLILCKNILTTNTQNCPYHFELPLKSVYETLFGKSHEFKQFDFGSGAQFIASKNCIQKRPREFYKKIVDLLSTSVSPIEGYVIERYHTLIFNPS